jgi:hypothetical protein
VVEGDFVIKGAACPFLSSVSVALFPFIHIEENPAQYPQSEYYPSE